MLRRAQETLKVGLRTTGPHILAAAATQRVFVSATRVTFVATDRRQSPLRCAPSQNVVDDQHRGTKLTANTPTADKRRMASKDQAGTSADESSGETRSLTKRMLDLIHRFDAEERRRRTEPDASDPTQRRRRDDKPASASTGADDLIVDPAQSE